MEEISSVIVFSGACRGEADPSHFAGSQQSVQQQVRYHWRIPLNRATVGSKKVRRDLNHAGSLWTLAGMQNRSTSAAFAGHLPDSGMFADPNLFALFFLPGHLMTFSRVRQRYQVRGSPEKPLFLLLIAAAGGNEDFATALGQF